MAVVATALFVTGATIAPVSATGPLPVVSAIIIPNHASYEYKIGDFAGRMANAPFGSVGSCPISRTVNTEWPVNTTITLVKYFRLPAATQNLRVLISIDNDAEVFINDVSIGRAQNVNCARIDESVLRAPDSLLKPGTNSIRIVARDRGVESFLDLRVHADLPYR